MPIVQLIITSIMPLLVPYRKRTYIHIFQCVRNGKVSESLSGQQKRNFYLRKFRIEISYFPGGRTGETPHWDFKGLNYKS